MRESGKREQLRTAEEGSFYEEGAGEEENYDKHIIDLFFSNPVDRQAKHLSESRARL